MRAPVDPDRLTLRRAGPEDLEFLREVHHAAMRPHVEEAWGRWEPERQRELFLAGTDPRVHDVVEYGGTPVGCRWVRRHADSLELVRIYLLPEVQGAGIGTILVRRLLDEATAAGLAVRLRVLKRNPARRLYQRLGFADVAETEAHFVMRWE